MKLASLLAFASFFSCAYFTQDAANYNVSSRMALVLALLLSPGISPGTGRAELKHGAFEIVRDDPGIVTRYVARPSAIPAETWIEDDELLELLRAAKRATGLIRIDDRVILTVDVTDNPPE